MRLKIFWVAIFILIQRSYIIVMKFKPKFKYICWSEYYSFNAIFIKYNMLLEFILKIHVKSLNWEAAYFFAK